MGQRKADEGKYTINYIQFQGVCMLYDWLCSNDEFCADNYNFQFKLKGKGRSVKWEMFLYGGMSINVDRDRAEVLPKGVLPASLCNDRCRGWSRQFRKQWRSRCWSCSWTRLWTCPLVCNDSCWSRRAENCGFLRSFSS